MTDYNNGYQNGGQQNQNYNPQNGGGQPPIYNPPQYQSIEGMDPPPGYMQKDRKVAGLLAMFLGTLGAHSFYMGNTSRGLVQLFVSLFTCGVGAIVMLIWGLMDGVKILDGRINTDAYGIYLKD